jgi:DNA-binding CsgD family transcriptional regulator
VSERLRSARDPSALRQTYASIIDNYLGGQEEHALREAHEAGRRAVGPAGVVPLIEAYHAALARAVAGAGSARGAARIVESAAVLIGRSVASYEWGLSAGGQAQDGGGSLEGLPPVPAGEDRESRFRSGAADAHSDERARLASAVHADAIESLAAVATRLDLMARQIDDRDAAADIEKLREAVIMAHATTVSLADAREVEREGARPPAARVPLQGDGEPPPAEEALTEREREILSMVSAGATNADIAKRLVISQSTVKSHVKNIMRKLGVRNRTQAAARYFGP